MNPALNAGALDLVVDAGNGNIPSRSCSAPVWVVDRCPYAASTGNRWDEWAAHLFAGRVHYLRGELEPAVRSFEEGLALVVDGGAAFFELWVRPQLARAHADEGNIAAARDQIERCLALVGSGEDWRARTGHVALAEAVVLAREGRFDEADAAFARARAIFERYRLPVAEAELLREWGRALGDAEKLAEATELLRRHGAGPSWFDRVSAAP